MGVFWAFGKTACAEHGFWVVKLWWKHGWNGRKKLAEDTPAFFTFLRLFFAQLLSGRLPVTGAFRAVTFRIDTHLND
jgi:hypothetical protein